MLKSRCRRKTVAGIKDENQQHQTMIKFETVLGLQNIENNM